MTEYDLGKVVGDDGEAGNGIASITKTGTSGLVDTYTITYDDGTTTTFTVTNGSDASVTIQTSWGSTTSDSKVPSEKLTKDTLDTKIAKSSTTGLMKNDGTVMTSGTGSTNYSAGNHTHSNYISTSSTSGLVKNDGTIDTTSYSTFSGSYNDLTNKPTIPSASTTTPSADTASGSYGSGTSYARSNHTHPKSSLYAESSHTHTVSNITDFPSIPSSSSDLSDGSNIVKKSSTSGLLKNDGTVDTTSYLSSLPSHNHDDRYYTESEVDTALSSKQATLVSGTNIKTINNNSLLGSGNITIEGGGGSGGSYINDFYGDSSTNELVIDYDTGVSQADIVTSWSSTPSDTNVPSEKLVKEYIDNQIGTAIQYIQQ